MEVRMATIFTARVPLFAFRVPDGKVTITLKLPNARCTTAVIVVADLGFGHFRAAVGPESLVIEPGTFG